MRKAARGGENEERGVPGRMGEGGLDRFIGCGSVRRNAAKKKIKHP